MTIVTKNKETRQQPFNEERLIRFMDSVLLAEEFNTIPEQDKVNFRNKIIRQTTRLEKIRAREISNKLIQAAKELISREHPEWTFVASRFKLRELYKEASYNRSYDPADKYGNLFGLLKYLGDKGIYSELILKEYTSDEIKLAESFIDPEKDHLFSYIGIDNLSERYLTKDYDKRTFELPQERFLIIAMHLMSKEDKSIRMDKIKESYWALSNHYMTVATPTWNNAGLRLGQLSSCFTPETMITTEVGKTMIKDVTVDDLVLTHDGSFKPVTEVIKNYESEKVLGLSFMGTPKELRVTKEHPILTLTTKNDTRNMDKVTEGVTSNMHWVKAGDLKQKDYVALATRKFTSNVKKTLNIKDYVSISVKEAEGLLVAYKTGTSIRSLKRHNFQGDISNQITKIKSTISCDFNFGKFIGLFLAEGHVIKGIKDNEKVPHGVCFTLNSKHNEDIEFIKEFLEVSFEVKPTTRINDDGSTNVYGHSSLLGEFIFNLIGTGFDKKTLPLNYEQYPIEFLDGICQGVFLGDGCTTKSGVKLQLTNLPLIDQLNDVMNFLELYPSHRECITASGKIGGILELNIKSDVEAEFALKVSKNHELLLKSLNGKHNQYTYAKVDGYILKRISKIKEYHYDGVVYNLEVKDNHTYVAEGIIVHNCFIDTVEDSLEDIYNSNTDNAKVSKFGGGIGIYMGKVRSKGSDIRGYKGASSGVIPWIKQLNNTAVSVDQLGQRQGAIAVYLDVWHKDIIPFLELKLNNGDERMRAHDIFTGVTLPDIFMEQVEKRGEWYLFDPHEVKSKKGWSLEDFYDEKEGKGSFRNKYDECVSDNNISKTKIPAIEIMKKIMRSQLETGVPFMFYRDEVNRKNPNKHAGMIYSSNLC